jgi:stearoyl-CoA desaturase (delta-9 desaturase)
MREDRAAGQDSSQNITWLGFLQFLQGENWHENHHSKPSSARLGWTFWQIDFGWYTIVVLEKLGLATKVKRPRITRNDLPTEASILDPEPATAS